MTRFLTLSVLLALSAEVSAAPVPKELKRPSEAERMRGVWMADGIAPLRWYFDGDTLYVGGSNTTDNKGMDYALASRSGDLDFGGGNRSQYYGIYKFEGNDLRFAYKVDERPKDFTPRPGEFHHVLKPVPETKK